MHQQQTSTPLAGPAAVEPAPGIADKAPQDAAALFTSLYDQLARVARREVRRNGAHELVSTGTLVHEAWIDISRREELAFAEPAQFIAYATRTMRGLVIDRLRAEQAQKRGGDYVFTGLDTASAEQIAEPEKLEHIGEALDELATVEPELAQVVDLKFFCGFTLAEIAVMKGVSERTVQRHWDKARMLLHRALS